MAFTIGEYQDIFLEEADEQLQELNQSLLELEQKPDNIDTINTIFRTAHSLKSSAAFVGLYDLSDLAHKMENLLQGIRDKTMEVSSEVVDALFKCFDSIKSVIDSVASGEEPTQDLSGIMERIKLLSEGKKAGGKKEEDKKSENKKPSMVTSRREEQKTTDIPKINYTAEEKKRIKSGLDAGRTCCEVDIYIDPAAPMRWIKAQLIINNLEQESDILKTFPAAEDLTEDWNDAVFKILLLTDQSSDDIRRACELDLVNKVDMRRISLTRKNNKYVLKFHETEILIDEIDDVAPGKVYSGAKGIKERDVFAADEHETIVVEKRKDDRKAPSLKIVKVSVDKLDLLLNNVGELVIANSGFFKLYEELKKSNIEKSVVSEFKNRMEQMSRIAKDLQSGIMKTRMVPIGQVFTRFNRLVRDLSKDTDKIINLEIKGEDTELDKKVVDTIGEPLMHLIRNSIDHGVETAEERKKKGKPPEAVVKLNAYQGGNQILVEVSDDGRGLNLEKIKKTALNKNLITRELLVNMDDKDIYEFIFYPGFSTADVITDVSGRGVGMNVVKETVTELNGSVRIDTEQDVGTTFTLTFPLTLAIVPAIMVRVKNEMYAIPLPDVIETIKVSSADITTIEGREVVNLRGEILSLVRLNEFIGIDSSLKDNNKIPVVVVGFSNRKIGIIVDDLEGKQEIVIKSLEENYTSIEGLSGASILGDGNICLILDVASMINKVIMDEEKLAKQRKLERIDNSARDKGKSYIVKETVKSRDTGETHPIKSESEGADKQAEKDDSLKHQKKEIIVKEESSAKRSAVNEKDIIKEDIIYNKESGNAKKEQIISKQPLNIPDIQKKERIHDNIKDEEIEKKVKESLNEFRKELEENIKSTAIDAFDRNHIEKVLQISKDDINKFSIITNVGIANAAESLSNILHKSISLSIPEVEIIPVKKIPETLGEIDSVYLGVHMVIVGDVSGAVLFCLSEDSGFELIDLLYGTSRKGTKKLTEDGESALKEITNIVGSSIINVLAEKSGLSIRPEVPTITHDYIQATMDSIFMQSDVSDEYSLYMETYFYYQDDRILGKMLILTKTESLKTLIKKIR